MSGITSNRFAPVFGSAEPIAPEDRFEPVGWPFRVLARTGKVLGNFDTLSEALTAYNAWAQATAIIIGNYVVCDRLRGDR